MTLALSLADNADGTGGVATVSGVGAAANVTLYRTSWTGLMQSYSWTSTGTRVGPGTINVAPGNGYYQWQAVSVDAGVTEVGPLYYQNLTDAATEAVHYAILQAVRLGIVSLSLTGLTGAKIMRRWLPRAWEAVDDPPCIFVCPVGAETYPVQMNSTDDVSYPVVVAIIDKLQGDASENLNRDLLWRERIEKLLRFQRLSGVPSVMFAESVPDQIIDSAAWAANYLLSVSMFRFVSRQLRGLGA